MERRKEVFTGVRHRGSLRWSRFLFYTSCFRQAKQCSGCVSPSVLNHSSSRHPSLTTNLSWWELLVSISLWFSASPLQVTHSGSCPDFSGSSFGPVRVCKASAPSLYLKLHQPPGVWACGCLPLPVNLNPHGVRWVEKLGCSRPCGEDHFCFPWESYVTERAEL